MPEEELAALNSAVPTGIPPPHLRLCCTCNQWKEHAVRCTALSRTGRSCLCMLCMDCGTVCSCAHEYGLTGDGNTTTTGTAAAATSGLAGELLPNQQQGTWSKTCLEAAQALTADDNNVEPAHVSICGECGAVQREPVASEAAEAAASSGTASGLKATKENKGLNQRFIQPRVLPPCEEVDNKHQEGFHGLGGDTECATCYVNNQESRDKRRGAASRDLGGFAVDIAVRYTDASPVQGTLVATSTAKHRRITVARGLTDRSASTVYITLLKILLVAECIWGASPVQRVHSDREPALVSLESRLNEGAVMLTTTEGYASASNALAENAINTLEHGARAALGQGLINVEDEKTKKDASTFLWHHAMEFAAALWSAMEVEKVIVALGEVHGPNALEEIGKKVHPDNLNLRFSKMRFKDFLPFLAMCSFRKGHKIKAEKDAPVGRRCLYLGPNFDVSLGSTVMNTTAPYRIEPTTTIAMVTRNHKPQFPTTLSLPSEELGEDSGYWENATWIQCSNPKCGKWRLAPSAVASQFEGDDKEFFCRFLTDTDTGKVGSCRDKQDPAAFDDDATRRITGKDRRTPKAAAATFAKKPARLVATARLGKALNVTPDKFEKLEQRSSSFLALLDFMDSEDGIRFEQEADARREAGEDPDPIDLGVEWSCIQNGTEGKTKRAVGLVAHAQKNSVLLDWKRCNCECPMTRATDGLRTYRTCTEWFAVTPSSVNTTHCAACRGGCLCRCALMKPPMDDTPATSVGGDSDAESAATSGSAGETSDADESSPRKSARRSVRGRKWRKNNTLLEQCREHNAFVVKTMTLKEAANRPKYKETVAAEVGRHLQFGSFGKPICKITVPASAIIYKGKMIYGVKNWETLELHKDKARFVVQGCIRITKSGRVMLEKYFKKPGEFWAPTSSMAGFRFVCCIGAIYGRDACTIDLDSAYVQSWVTEQYYLMFDSMMIQCLPDDWQAAVRKAQDEDKQLGGKGEVLFPVVKNIYGRSDAGTNFINDFQASLVNDGWARLPHDHALLLQFCEITKTPMVMSNYVDDLAAVLSEESSARVWEAVRRVWKFDDPRIATKFLGIVRWTSACKRMVELEQKDFILSVVDKYETATGRKVKSRVTLPGTDPTFAAEVTTAASGPASASLAAEEPVLPAASSGTASWEPVGVEQQEAGTIVRGACGGLSYAARGTRPDIARANNTVARNVTKWNDTLTLFLEALLGYVMGTIETVLVIDARKGPMDVRGWRQDSSADADYRHPKCFSGQLHCFTPVDADLSDNCFLPHDWSCSGQTYAKLAPSESEFVGAVHGMRAGVHFNVSWEDVCQYDPMAEDRPPCCVMRQREDNSQCILFFKRGWSPSMVHVPRVYGVAVMWGHERIMEGIVEMTYEMGSKMIADPLTKLTKPDILFLRGILRRTPELVLRTPSA